MNRGVRDSNIFVTDHDRRLFIRLATETSNKYQIRVLGYCLMPNHFHLILECPEGGLSAMMRDLCGRYARAFNRTHGLRGSLFGQRFHSVTIDTDNQLLATSRYVDRNPLELGIDIVNYQWSGYHQTISATPTGLTEPGRVLEAAGGPDNYEAFVQAPLPSDCFDIGDGTRTSPHSTPVRPRDVVELIKHHTGKSCAEPTQRLAAVVIALDRLSLDPVEVAEVLHYPTPQSARNATCRARRRLVNDTGFADLVHSIGTQIAA